MVTLIFAFCIILIILMIVLVGYNINFYRSLKKEIWAESEIVISFFMTVSLVFLTTGVFIDFNRDRRSLPLYLLVLFFEFLYLISIYARMYSDSELIGALIFLLTASQIIIQMKSKNKEITWLFTPFLIFSLFQIGLSSSLYRNNVDHLDLVRI